MRFQVNVNPHLSRSFSHKELESFFVTIPIFAKGAFDDAEVKPVRISFLALSICRFICFFQFVDFFSKLKPVDSSVSFNLSISIYQIETCFFSTIDFNLSICRFQFTTISALSSQHGTSALSISSMPVFTVFARSP